MSGPKSNIATTGSCEGRLKIRWADLGQPTEPCIRDYNGDIVEVRQRDIDAVVGNPDAVFAVSLFRLWTGPTYYRLGDVNFPSSTPAASLQSPQGARHV